MKEEELVVLLDRVLERARREGWLQLDDIRRFTVSDLSSLFVALLSALGYQVEPQMMRRVVHEILTTRPDGRRGSPHDAQGVTQE